MKEEIAAAVFFIARLVKRYSGLDGDGRRRFAAALTSLLFETYKNHWEPSTPCKGQAYRCLRMNRVMLRDPVLELACVRSGVRYEGLGLPRELTLWVDPGEVSCRYGENTAPFCVSLLSGDNRSDREFSHRIQRAVERASLDVPSGASSDDEEDVSCGDTSRSSSSCSSSNPSVSLHLPASAPLSRPEQKTIPTVSNPNSIYQFNEFATSVPQPWVNYPKRKAFTGDGFPPHFPTAAALPPPGPQFHGQKAFRSHRPSFSFSGPRVDKYHWVSKSRS
ncbi:protein BTG4 [Gadus macrocephalus]|uniref:protein BTG4 n=1 Tax=Gadus macrocephalus TaxID=80720 RepID=UPI0028CB597E|nr:protein BTG4 [Gadus macrocephalus]